MNYDLTGGNPSKPMPIMDNYVRDDTGGQIFENGVNPGNPSEVNMHQEVNGSSDKPFPQERNFMRNNNPDDGFSGNVSEPSTTAPDVSIGQVKYARREGAESIYKDATRNTANDNAASAKAEGSTIYETEGENEESQGI